MDATQCYDRVAHTMASLTLRVYKVRQISVMEMLEPIQNMEYYLRTGFGESSKYLGGKDNKKQGLCQGNAAARSAWQMLTSLLVNAQHQQDHGINIVSLILKNRSSRSEYYTLTTQTSGLDWNTATTSCQQHRKDKWVWIYGGGLLQAVGGLLQPPKCT